MTPPLVSAPLIVRYFQCMYHDRTIKGGLVAYYHKQVTATSLLLSVLRGNIDYAQQPPCTRARLGSGRRPTAVRLICEYP